MKKHKGATSIIAIIFMAFTTIMLTSILSITFAMSTKTESKTEIYTRIAICEMIADAFVSDLNQITSITPQELLTDYQSGIDNIQNALFDDDKKYIVHNPSYLILNNDAISEQLATEMKYMTMDLILLSNLEIDYGNDENITNSADMDTMFLKNIDIEIQLTDGVYSLTQQYEISNVKAIFKYTSTKTSSQLNMEDMIITKISQEVK